MAEQSGSQVLLQVDDNGTMRDVGSQTGLSRDRTRDMIETTAKSDDKKTYIYGKGDSTISLDALYVPSNADFDVLDKAYKNSNTVTVRIDDTGNSRTLEATALIDSFTDDFPDNEGATISIDLQIDGSWSTV